MLLSRTIPVTVEMTKTFSVPGSQRFEKYYWKTYILDVVSKCYKVVKYAQYKTVLETSRHVDILYHSDATYFKALNIL